MSDESDHSKPVVLLVDDAVTTEDEEARLRALFDLRLDEPAPEPGMQRFLDEIAELFGVPVAGISAVTRDRQQLVTHCSAVEYDEGGPRKQSFCTHAVAARAALVIQDAVENPFFRDNPSVTVRGFRFYAGVPLMPVQGEAVGTLCILDYQSHGFSAADLELLSVFARRVLAALDRRHKAAHPEIPESAYRYRHQFDEELDIYGRALFADLIAVESARSVAASRTTALVAADLDADHLKDAVACLRGTARGGLIGRLGRCRLGVIALDRDAREAEEWLSGACGLGSRVVAVNLDRFQGGVASQALVHLEQALDATAPTPS